MGNLVVSYANNKIEAVCTQEKVTKKEWGAEFVKPLQNRLGQLKAADCLGDLIGNGSPGRWEIMTGDKAGQASARLTANWRLMLAVEGTNADEIRHVVVLGREDYH